MQRYSIECDDVGPLGVAKDDDGEYVRYDDHAELCKAVVNAEELADKIMFEDDWVEKLRLGEQLDDARNHMLKLAKDGHDDPS